MRFAIFSLTKFWIWIVINIRLNFVLEEVSMTENNFWSRLLRMTYFLSWKGKKKTSSESKTAGGRHSLAVKKEKGLKMSRKVLKVLWQKTEGLWFNLPWLSKIRAQSQTRAVVNDLESLMKQFFGDLTKLELESSFIFRVEDKEVRNIRKPSG